MFFSTQPQCCLTFLWIELQMLLMCCLIQISIIILRQFLYLVCSSPSLRPGLLCCIHVIYSSFSLKQTRLFLSHMFYKTYLYLDNNMDEESKWFSNSKSPNICLIIYQLQPGVAYKSVVSKHCLFLLPHLSMPQ